MGFLTNFFTWSRKERMGVVVLSVFLFTLFFSDVYFNRIYPFKDYTIHPDTLIVYQKLLEELENDIKVDVEFGVPEKKEKNKAMERAKVKIQVFDPNILKEEGWRKLGFSSKQALAIINYKNVLGGFKQKEDLLSSFVIDDKKYKELEPFIRIVEEDASVNTSFNEKNNESSGPKPEKETLFIELNSSDSLLLLQLKGIGPFYSRKIIEYREQLGGYYSTKQLLEIWKFDLNKLNQIEDYIWIDTTDLYLLNINSDSIQLLYKHPYINWNQAKAIVNYREQHGDYITKNELLELVLINDSLLSKLYPYISLK